MRRATAWIVSVVLICQPVLAVEINASEEDLQACQTEGGCALVTLQWLKRYGIKAFDAGFDQCKADNRNRT